MSISPFWTMFLSNSPSHTLSLACDVAYCSLKVSTIFLFSMTFVLMLWNTLSTFHVHWPILKLETAAESASACASEETTIGWQRYFLKDQWKDQVVRVPGQKTWNCPVTRTPTVRGLKPLASPKNWRGTFENNEMQAKILPLIAG